MANPSPFVVSPTWLEEHLADNTISVVDGSWYLPAQQRDAQAEFNSAHIPGAVFFDHDEVVDPQSTLPHTIPSPDAFAKHAGAMGLEAEKTIVVYDGPGFFTAPRVWWMLRVMGASRVFILDGGFDSWKADGRPVTDDMSIPQKTVFLPFYQQSQIVPFADMIDVVESGKAQILDARNAERFYGRQAEPREGMRSGHMPGALNLPFSQFSENGYFKDMDTIKAMLAQSGVDTSRPVITTCGSGVTAAVINFALASLGHSDTRLYDGSWSEWGSRPDTAVQTGE